VCISICKYYPLYFFYIHNIKIYCKQGMVQTPVNPATPEVQTGESQVWPVWAKVGRTDLKNKTEAERAGGMAKVEACLTWEKP
jgi:hypothetical protein